MDKFFLLTNSLEGGLSCLIEVGDTCEYDDFPDMNNIGLS